MLVSADSQAKNISGTGVESSETVAFFNGFDAGGVGRDSIWCGDGTAASRLQAAGNRQARTGRPDRSAAGRPAGPRPRGRAPSATPAATVAAGPGAGAAQ